MSNDAEWLIEPFDKARHDRTGFDCGSDSLNLWLQNGVSQYTKKNLARAYVATRKGERAIAGYYAMCSHAVLFNDTPSDATKGIRAKTLPTMLLGRLAVDRSIHRGGLGSAMLYHALRRAERHSRDFGCWAVEVDAIDERAKEWYLRFGFQEMLDNRLHLYPPMTTIVELVAEEKPG